MVSAGRARRVDADSLLGMFDAEPPPPGTPEGDLVAALAPYVRVAGTHDENAAIDEVITRIDEARSSVWCWSAWVGRNSSGILEALYRAHQRGVSVHVMARPEREVQEANRESLRRLQAWMPRLVFMQKMHQKDRDRGPAMEHRRQYEHAFPWPDVLRFLALAPPPANAATTVVVTEAEN
jgi:hypothetical protein